jgi:uncharacterized protein YcbK (DUF882 family)
LPSRTVRFASSCSLAALLLFGCAVLQAAKAVGETRTISFYNTHTKENLTITYKVSGRYDPEALNKINHFMRDWRQNKPTRMDPELIDLLWEVHRETGAREPISVVCGYRSPETNNMLRNRSRGVAKASQHMLGKAIDFFIPGVSIDELRAAGLRAQRGGVGYYSSSSFVHMDTGSVRHWPRLPDAQVAKIMAKGQLASHDASDDRSTRRVNVAEANIARSGTPMPSFLSKLFGSGEDHENDAGAAATVAPAQTAPAAPKIARAATVARASDKPAVLAAAPEPRREKVGAIPMPQAKPVKALTYQVASAGSVPVKLPGYEVASATATPVHAGSVRVAQVGSALPVRAETDSPARGAAPAQAASLAGRSDPSANDIINDRGYWQGLPSTDTADAAQTTVTRAVPASRRGAERVATANLAPWPIAERGNDRAPSVGALGYAPQTASVAPTLPGAAGDSRVAAVNSNALPDVRSEISPPVTERKGPDIVQVGDRFNDPWMRAMMVSPSVQRFLKTTLYGAQDFLSLRPLLAKPVTVVSAKFVNDPMNGMSTERFGGNAVAFTQTVGFVSRTASLR